MPPRGYSARLFAAGATSAHLHQGWDGHRRWARGMGISRSRLLSAVEGSLRRLQTDHIDLFQLHAYDASTPMEEVLQTLELLVQQGKSAIQCPTSPVRTQ